MAQTIWGGICRTGAFYTYIDISQLAQIHEGVWTSARSEVYDHTLRRVTLSWPRSRATWLVPRPKPRPSRARFVSTFTQSRLERCRKRCVDPKVHAPALAAVLLVSAPIGQSIALAQALPQLLCASHDVAMCLPHVVANLIVFICVLRAQHRISFPAESWASCTIPSATTPPR